MSDAEVSAVVLFDAGSPADMAAARRLFREYQESLNVSRCFQGFETELAALPGCYASPAGRLILARDASDMVVGGVGMCPLKQEICEMKRLYVRPNWRGSKLGYRLAEASIKAARQAGYARMRLHTLKRLAAAIALYRSMGFTEIPAYHDTVSDADLCMELDLRMERAQMLSDG